MAKQRAKPRLGRFGEPAILILLSLSSGTKHGYAIMVDIEGSMGVSLGAGTLYGAIAKLMKLGMIRPLPSEERTRPYEITPEGRAEMATFLETWSPIVRLGEARLA